MWMRERILEVGRLAFPGETDFTTNQELAFLLFVVLFFGAVFYFFGDRLQGCALPAQPQAGLVLKVVHQFVLHYSLHYHVRPGVADIVHDRAFALSVEPLHHFVHVALVVDHVAHIEDGNGIQLLEL